MQVHKPFCTDEELYFAVAVIFCALFYNRSVTELLNEDNRMMYNVPIVDKQRMLLIIRSIEGEQIETSNSYHTNYEIGDMDIEKIENEFAAIYCSLGAVSEMNLSADDDIIRFRSKKVPYLTVLKQIHVSNQGMGCVQTTVACPLTNITLCSPYSVQQEPYVKTLQILLRRIQQRGHDHLIDFGFLSTIYLDRGYVFGRCC